MSALRFASLLLLAALPCTAQKPDTPHDQLFTATHQQLDVTKVVLAQERAWNDGDLDGYLSHFKNAADTTAVLAGLIRGTPNVRNAYHLNFPRRETMGILEQSEVEVRSLGDNFALATGHYHLTRTKKGGGDADGVFTEVFERTPAGWQIIFSQTT